MKYNRYLNWLRQWFYFQTQEEEEKLPQQTLNAQKRKNEKHCVWLETTLRVVRDPGAS